ncbi:MAG: M15 family metallopeptidase [Chromatiaceae bacterium]|nr:M15 family metallopeptidase [Chromatiaceae bacterium]
MNPRFSTRSFNHLVGVRPELIIVAYHALILSPVPFQITDGVRTRAEQEKLLAEGKSKTMKSRHLTGHAVDVVAIVDGKVTWDWQCYEAIAEAFKKAAEALEIKIVWGGDWKGFRDGPHFELDRAAFPSGRI